MHIIIFPSKDATIYSKFPYINTGLDELLELKKEVNSSIYKYKGMWDSNAFYSANDYVSGSDGYYRAVAENINELTSSSYWISFNPTSATNYSRILIQFDLNSFTSESYASASLVYLNLYTCLPDNISTEYDLNVYAVSGSWDMGVGNFTDKAHREGVTWVQRTSENVWDIEGATFHDTASSKNFNFTDTDIRIDVTDIFKLWKSGSISNDGFLVKRPALQELNLINYGNISFYSRETHTVYLPTLEILYDDTLYDSSLFLNPGVSGSVSGSFISGSIDVYIKNFMSQYRYNSTVRFDVELRNLYQTYDFYENKISGSIKYISDFIYYSVVDAYSNRVIIPFSDYTKICLNNTGYYFNLCLSGFIPNRFYKIVFKANRYGSEQYFDNKYQFKVIK